MALIGAFYLTLCTQLSHAGPAPTDDLFYIDAAHRISVGEYACPTRSFPFHHYLRWPVVLPLALVVRLGGMSHATLTVFTSCTMLAVAILTFVLIRKLTGLHLPALLAAFAPLLMPPGTVPLLVRTEPIVLIWTLCAARLALATPDRRGIAMAAVGACMALAINANQAAVFAVAVAPMLALAQARSGRDNKRALIAYAGGIALAYGVIIGAEWSCLGDPTIELKTIRWWHAQSLEAHALTDYVDVSNPEWFAFGFLTNLARQYPLLLVALLLLMLALLSEPNDAAPDSARAVIRPLFAACLISVLGAELLGPLVMKKIHLRLFAVPLYLLCTIALAVIGLFLRQRGTRRAQGLCRGAIMFALALHICANWRAAFGTNDSWFNYYHDSINSIVNDAKNRGVGPDRLTILSDADGPRGLIPWQWAANVYSDYWLKQATILTHVPATCPTAPGIAYFIQLSEGSAPGPEFHEIAYTRPSETLRPKVYVCTTSR